MKTKTLQTLRSGYTHRAGDLVAVLSPGMIDRALDIMDKTKDLPVGRATIFMQDCTLARVMAKVLTRKEGGASGYHQPLEESFKSGRIL